MTQAEYREFLYIFFENNFVFLIILCSAWFISSRKPVSQRLYELLFLNSLPISTNQICDRYLYYDLRKYSWVPFITIILNIGLLEVSSFNFVIRSSFIIPVSYLLFTIGGFNLNILLSIKNQKIKNHYFPQRYSTIVYALIVTGYLLIYLILILYPDITLTINYFAILSALILIIYFLRLATHRLFYQWMDAGLYLQKSIKSKKSEAEKRFSFLRLAKMFPQMDPLLMKNIIGLKTQIANSSLILTLVYISVSYVLSNNNSLIENVELVLYVFSIIYSIQFAYRTINVLTENNESQQIIYSLPVRIRNLYFSLFIPSLVWLFLVMTLFSGLLLFSGNQMIPTVQFFIINMGVVIFLLHLSVSQTILFFPDTKKAANNYLLTILVLLFFTAILFRYYLIILFISSIILLVMLSKKNLYRIT